MKDYQLLIDLHKNAKRQGPGGDTETERAISMSVADRSAPLQIADIGCGTGASTLLLAQLSEAQITAVDFLPDFLAVLESRSADIGVSEKISPLCGSMESLPFGDVEFDAIWSEGAIYNLGLRFVNIRSGEKTHHKGDCHDFKIWPCAYEIVSYDYLFSI